MGCQAGSRLSEPSISFLTRLLAARCGAGSGWTRGSREPPGRCDPQHQHRGHISRSSTTGQTSGEAPGPEARHGQITFSVRRPDLLGFEAKLARQPANPWHKDQALR